MGVYTFMARIGIDKLNLIEEFSGNDSLINVAKRCMLFLLYDKLDEIDKGLLEGSKENDDNYEN